MADIRKYIKDTLLDPLRYYPTAIQDTMIELISEKLETLYNYTVAFPSIVSPDMNRYDILKTIAEQFEFTIREDGDLQEQIDILTNILEVYNKRGSIDTIENMWKYYGGNLPKDVQVIIPSYKIFRYNISSYSGNHVYEDNTTHRSGVYEVKLINNTYPIPELKDFMVKELVAAGNYFYFSNEVNLDLRKDSTDSHYKYDIMKDNLLDIHMQVAPLYEGQTYSGSKALKMSGSFDEIRYQYLSLTEEEKELPEYADLVRAYKLLGNPEVNTRWSGRENIFIDITHLISYEVEFDYLVDALGFYRMYAHDMNVIDERTTLADNLLHLVLNQFLYCTPSSEHAIIEENLYNAQGDHMRRKKYFILGDSLLGEPLGYELI